MKKGFVAALCLASMALTACGGSYCDDVKSAQEDLREKACSGSELPNLSEAECKEDWEEANDAQKEEAEKTIKATRSCIDKLDDCTEATAQAWEAAKDACLAGGTAGDQD